jgi:hypothetical protein
MCCAELSPVISFMYGEYAATIHRNAHSVYKVQITTVEH